MKKAILFSAAALVLTAAAYLPPVDERCGVKVEIGSFPQKIDRSGANKFLWPLGVTEVKGGAPRSFPVTLENKTGAQVSGEIEVWMNDDWDVKGPQGPLTLAPGEKRELSYAGAARPRALDALYPVHARFTPAGAKREDAPHPVAVFQYRPSSATYQISSSEMQSVGKYSSARPCSPPRIFFTLPSSNQRAYSASSS